MTNIFSGTITFEGIPDLKFLDFKHFALEGEKTTTLFLFGTTEASSSKELIKQICKDIGSDYLHTDISISTEDKISILNDTLGEEGVYETVSFEGPEVSYRDIVDRFLDNEEVISIREAEESKNYGNRIIKVDFIY